jgi:hypothetical protein
VADEQDPSLPGRLVERVERIAGVETARQRRVDGQQRALLFRE